MKITGKNKKQKYSLFSIIKHSINNHENWNTAWRNPTPKKSYDAIIVGGDNENKMLRPIARFSFLKIFKNIEYRNKEPKPIHIENA